MHKLRIFGIFAALALLIAACGGPTTPPGTHTLTVNVNGDGTVHFDTATGDDASGDHNIEAGTVVTLVAVEGTEPFVGWGDECSGTELTCEVTMDSDKVVTATFEAPDLPAEVPMSVEFSNDSLGGTVTATGINCTFDPASPDPAGPDCSEDAVSTSTPISLTAAPTEAGMSVQWVGIAGCADGATECEVTPNANPFVVTVRFFDPSEPEVITKSRQVADGVDDGFEWVDDANNVGTEPTHAAGYSYNDLTYNALSYFSNYDAEVVSAFIFRDLEIPANATITDAYLEFTGVSRSGHTASDGNDAVLIFRAEASLEPAAIPHEAAGNPITSRPRVATEVPVTITETVTSGQSFTTPSAVDDPSQSLVELLQAVVDQAGWDETSDAMIMAFNNDADASEGWRKIQAYEGNSMQAPVLHYSYQVP